MKLFAQIRKIDEAKRLVITRVVEETPDKVDEMFDYATSKPYFEAWSKNQFEASKGKSYGNVRAMHGKSAAGIVAEPLTFSDTEKAIDAAIKVTDDQDWSKCLDGTYTGVSIGGSYVGERKAEKLADGREVKRYTANPVEVSLVDSPCIPTARFFEVIKLDGAIEKRAFKDPEVTVSGTPEEVDAFAKAMSEAQLTVADALKWVETLVAARAVKDMLETIDDLEKREFSTDERKQAAKEGQALPDGSFPIKNKSDLANAVKAYGRAKDKAAAKAHIVKRAKALGATDMLPEAWKDGGEKGEKMAKGLWNVARFADCLECLADCCRSAEGDLQMEGDGSGVPAAMRNALAEMIDCFKEMADEESAEMLAELKSHAGVGAEDEIEEAMEAAAKAGALKKRLNDPELPLIDLMQLAEQHLTAEERKPLKTLDAVRTAILAKAKMSAAHMDKMQAIHDHAADMGAECHAPEEGEKKAKGELAKNAAALSETAAALKKAEERIAALEAQPMPHPLTVLVTTKAVPKAIRPEVAELTIDKIPEADRVKNADGSLDQVATLLIARTKALASS